MAAQALELAVVLAETDVEVCSLDIQNARDAVRNVMLDHGWEPPGLAVRLLKERDLLETWTHRGNGSDGD
jgi:hypothetical protein